MEVVVAAVVFFTAVVFVALVIVALVILAVTFVAFANLQESTPTVVDKLKLNLNPHDLAYLRSVTLAMFTLRCFHLT